MEKADVVIIGAGVIGCAIARELSKFQLKIIVIEKNLDVCFETSGRNSAVLHGGFAYDIGSLKAECCVEGNQEFDKVAKELDVPFKRTGKLLVGNSEEDYEKLEATLKQGEQNGCEGLRMVSEHEIKKMVPLAKGKFGIFSPNSGIMDPFQYVVGLAENAKDNGVSFFFGAKVRYICREENGDFIVEADKLIVKSRWLINAAAMGGAKISEMAGIPGYYTTAGNGAYIILDKNMGNYLPMPVYPVPNNFYMGVHVTPTIDGNVLIGPTGIEMEDGDDYSVSQETIDFLAQSASKIWPCIEKRDYIRNYCGNCAKWYDSSGLIYDFKIEIRDQQAPHFINMVNMDSPALTSALPLARRCVNLIKNREVLQNNVKFNPIRKRPVRFSEMSNEERAEKIKENPEYGEIVCRCEQVSKAEIIEAIHNPLGVCTVAGIKLRTRAMMGRCQGGYCQMRLVKLIQEETGMGEREIVYEREGSYMFVGKVRT